MTAPTVTIARPAERNTDGAWLCNLDAKCEAVAIIQAPVDCDGCDEYVAETRARIDAKRKEHADRQQALDGIRHELAAAGRAPTPIEAAAAAQLQDDVQRLGADLERLGASAARRDGPHTHPAMACDKHGRKAHLI